LLVTAALNIPALSLGIALIGLPAGLLLLRRNSLTRAGMLAIIGFAIAGALAVLALVR
jgi:hypothetical protein